MTATPETTTPPKSLENGLGNKQNGDAIADNEMKMESNAQDSKSKPSTSPAASAPHPPGPPPDGGSAAWMTVVGGWFLLFTGFGWLNTIGVLQTYYEEKGLTDYSSSEISWIASTETFFFFFGAAVSGKIFDNYGPRPLLLVGGFLHILGLMMLSLSHEYYQFFLTQSVCTAWGACAISFASMNSVSTWFLKKRALALGTVMSGASLGGVIFPIIISRLQITVGFGWAIRAIGFITLGFVIIGVPLTKSRLQHRPTPLHIMEFIRPLSEVPFLLLALACFFFYFGVFLPINYIQLQGTDQGVTPYLASYLIPILNAASLFGRVLPGYLGDRFGRYNMMIFITISTVIIVFGLWIPGYGAAPIIVFAVLYGFCSGAFVALVPALVAQISEIRQIGVRNGTNYGLLSLTTLTGNPIGGALLGRDNGDFVYMKVFTGVTMVVGAAFFVANFRKSVIAQERALRGQRLAVVGRRRPAQLANLRPQISRPCNLAEKHSQVVRGEESPSSPPKSADEALAVRDASEPPDGGRDAWLQVLACFFVYFNTWGLINTFGTYETYYILNLPNGAFQIAWIGTSEAFFLIVFGIITGSLNDRGYFRPLMLVGSFLVVFGVMMTSLGTEYYQLYLAQGLCLGIGSACLYFPSIAVVVTYFKSRRAIATGIAYSRGQLAGFIYPIVFRQLQASIGFGWAVRVIGFIALATLTFANAIHKPRAIPTPKKLVDWTAFKDPAFLVFTGGIFLMFMGLYQPLYYTGTYGELVLGMSPGDAFYLTAILNGVSIVGCILPSYISDVFGAINVLIPCTFLTGMMAFVWMSIKSVPSLQAYVAFYGVFTGALITLVNPILASLSPRIETVGTRVGMGYTIASFGFLMGAPLGGLHLNLETADFSSTQIWGGCFLFGAAIMYTLAKFLQARQMGQTK